MRRFLRPGHDLARERLKRDLFQFNKVRESGDRTRCLWRARCYQPHRRLGLGAFGLPLPGLRCLLGIACNASWESDLRNGV